MRPHGMHDEEGRGIVPADGICLALTDLSVNSLGKNYKGLRPDVNWFVRLQWGYHGTGTIPQPERLNLYFDALTNFLKTTSGVYAFIVGNEPNHVNERPNGMVILPDYYFSVYKDVVALVRQYYPEVLVGPAAYAPYHASPTNWLDQYSAVLSLLETNEVGCDFINLHAYLRSSHPSAATSDEKMQEAPLIGQYASFRTYRDGLSVVPDSMRQLPAFITECNEILRDGWDNANTGVVRAVYREIDNWNGIPNVQKVRGVILYRWPNHDKFFIEGKQGVIDDFAQAVSEGSSNDWEDQGEVLPPVVAPPIQKPSTTIPWPPTDFPRELDARALARGVELKILPANVAGWRVKKIYWLDVKESQGRHHIYYDVINLEGNRVVAKDLIRVTWSTGFDLIDSEEKSGEPYSANFPMSSSRNDFSTWVVDGDVPSEIVTGIGMGADEGSGFNASAHTSTFIEYHYTQALEGSAPPEEVDEDLDLAHPVRDPRYRTVTQEFGENPQDYEKFGLPGHNGVDFATPLDSSIVAVDDGRVAWVKTDPEGFGLHIKIIHEWGESLYAHLEETYDIAGVQLEKGEVIALSGSSGNSSGPHLHFGIRPYPLDLSNGYNGYVDPIPYLEEGVSLPLPIGVPGAIVQAGTDIKVDWRLLASLAWAESSFRPQIEDGLFQIGSAAWSDWSKPGERRDNALDSAKVGARYYQFLLNRYNGDEEKALQAWNFGLDNVDKGISIPAITQEFVNKVRHGRDLLRAIGL